MTKWTKEQKKEFWEVFLRYRGELNITDSYRAAARELSAKGKPTPSLMTFRDWYRKIMREGLNSGENRQDRQDRQDRQTLEGQAAEEAAPAEEAAADNYTVRLEMMLRLYRRRSEADCDAVCDQLVPELLNGDLT